MKELIEEKLLLYKVQTEKDAEAFALLYDRYVDQVYRFVFFKLSHKQEAEDVTGDVFLKCWQFLTGEKGKTVRNFRSLLLLLGA
jgi:DNA-directed RNA polymerase specialized sigma24 family protein